jgi:hypothetical protein
MSDMYSKTLVVSLERRAACQHVENLIRRQGLHVFANQIFDPIPWQAKSADYTIADGDARLCVDVLSIDRKRAAVSVYGGQEAATFADALERHFTECGLLL